MVASWVCRKGMRLEGMRASEVEAMAQVRMGVRSGDGEGVRRSRAD